MRFMPRLVAVAVGISLIIAGFGHAVRGDDESDLLEVVKAYFDAEIAGDMMKVWEMLAPSSSFRRAYSYPLYVELIKDNPIRVQKYTIEKVLEIGRNEDKVQLPLVEMVASVQVRVVLSDKGGNQFERTSAFTFLRERGRWYKG